MKKKKNTWIAYCFFCFSRIINEPTAAAKKMQRAVQLFGDTAQAGQYAAHRPAYPAPLLASLCDYAAEGLGRRPTTTVDAACGSGQASLALARAEPGLAVTALDASAAQVDAARSAVAILGADAADEGGDGAAAAEGRQSRVAILHVPAEATGLPAGSADLVTIAQALHWCDVPAFYAEAARLLRPGGAVAVLSYTWPAVCRPGGAPLPAASAALLAAAHEPPLGRHWDAGRALVDAGLPGLDPPASRFEACERRRASMTKGTTAGGVGGFVRSWSAYAAWRRSGGEGGPDPAAALVEAVMCEVGGRGGDDPAVVLEWPVLVLLGRKKRGV
jgi:SAM-dependent methyltransferase